MTAAAVSTTEDATADAVLNIRVTNVRSESGHVLLLVFNDASGFPNVSGKAVHRVRIRAQKGRVSHSVPGLPPGRYAITVVHDETDNKNRFDVGRMQLFYGNEQLGKKWRKRLADGDRRTAELLKPLQLYLTLTLKNCGPQPHPQP